MMRSVRDTARTGHRGCRCCYPVPRNSTLRQREKNIWRDDYDDDEDEGN